MRGPSWRLWLAVAATVLLPARGGAGSQIAAAGDEPELTLAAPLTAQLEHRKLDNGFKLVLQPDDSAAVLASCLVFRVGSRDESGRRRGVAAFAAEALASGVPGYSRSELEQLVVERGGALTSEVDRDTTRLCAVLPSRELPLVFWLAAQRFRVGLPSDDVIQQYASAMDARRIRSFSEHAFESGELKLDQLAFEGLGSYATPPGVASVLAVPPTSAEVREFIRTHYVPSAASLAIVGRFDSQRVSALSTEFLEKLPSSKLAPAADIPWSDSSQTSERYALVIDEGAGTVGMRFAWLAPPKESQARTALELVAAVLGHGEGSRLHGLLVRKRRLALEVAASVGDQAGPGLLEIRVNARKGVDLNQVENLVAREITRMMASGPTKAELERARKMLSNEWLRKLDSNMNRAEWLAVASALGVEAPSFDALVAGYQAVDPGSARLAAAGHLALAKRSMVEIYPPDYPIQTTSRRMKRYHLVQSGQTLSGISKQYGVSLGALLAANKISRSAPIFPGQKLEIPGGGKPAPRTYTVKKGDSLIRIAKRHGVTVKALTSANSISRKKPIMPGQKLVIPPKTN